MPRTATAPVARPNFVPMPRTAPSAVTPVVAHLRTPPPDALIEPHRHEWGQLICPQRGGLRITAGETSLIVPVFRAAWVPAGMSHEVAVLGEAQFYAVYMMSEVSPLPAGRCLVLEVSPLLRDLAAAMAGGMASDDPRHGLVTSLLLEELRVAPTASLDLRMPDDRRLRPLCEGLMERPEDDRSLAQWAEDVGASERTLARLFSTELGTSFGVWRQRVRIARAVDWMSRGVPVATVASRLGYANPAAFSAMFRRALGVSPRDFTRVERARL
ncbi:HTH-type transcriptional regulator NimR [Pandoraea morbifera]|uniref:HTH-type transcriptional regulator NimR n=1 Tax=Pandoraea morbifera TaxID=2508300 RepID=A0A5E4YEW1_9BURK|nr:helix-turn-helix transcriptional regulator [Pandoraea morbifera]VVE47299.1 HTH-type transcriptional regulator NimR [Pandoraea morbifera]